MRTLGVIDLIRTRPDVTGWRELRSATAVANGALPPGSIVTPAGFAFIDLAEQIAHEGPRVEIVPPRDLRGPKSPDSTLNAPAAGERSLPIVILRPDSDRARVAVPGGGLVLHLGSEDARVEVAEQAWDLVAAPVLLVIAQSLRFRELDRRLDELCASVRRTTESTSRPFFRSDRSHVAASLQAFQRLLLELPGIEGPLTDPRGFFPTRRGARLYRQLARALGLASWRALIDERIEVVEATLSHLAEERRHRVSVTASLVLEVLILLVLFADLGINIAQMLSAE